MDDDDDDDEQQGFLWIVCILTLKCDYTIYYIYIYMYIYIYVCAYFFAGDTEADD